MQDYRFVPVFLVLLGVVASVLVLPDADDMSVMRDADAKRSGTSQALTIAAAQY